MQCLIVQILAVTKLCQYDSLACESWYLGCDFFANLLVKVDVHIGLTQTSTCLCCTYWNVVACQSYVTDDVLVSYFPDYKPLLFYACIPYFCQKFRNRILAAPKHHIHLAAVTEPIKHICAFPLQWVWSKCICSSYRGHEMSWAAVQNVCVLSVSTCQPTFVLTTVLRLNLVGWLPLDFLLTLVSKEVLWE